MRARGEERPGRRARPGLEPEPGSRSGMTPMGGGHLPAREEREGEGDAAQRAGARKKATRGELGWNGEKGPCARAGKKKRGKEREGRG
jgi:hypothetical protein